MRNEGEKKEGLCNGLVSDQQPLKDPFFFVPFFGLLILALRDPRLWDSAAKAGHSGTGTGTGQMLGLVLGKTRYLLYQPVYEPVIGMRSMQHDGQNQPDGTTRPAD